MTPERLSRKESAQKLVYGSYVFTLLFWLPFCWFVGFLLAIIAIVRSKGDTGVSALVINLSVILVMLMFGAFAMLFRMNL